jgi:uncharacterized NAD-dependent epimerase/dehydratase family protein
MSDTPETVVWFERPYVVFLGDVTNLAFAKTALGIVEWAPDGCLGQVRLPGCTVDAGVPDIDVARAASLGARTLILGSAAVGGGVSDTWIATLCDAARRGLDVVAGLHVPLASLPGLSEAAASGRARLVDARVPPAALPVGTGQRRSGRRLLTVGTDCASGKKYTALAIDRELRRRGVPSDFRATGQTGIMIAGRGIPLDAVVSDFVTGAAELLSPAAAPDHWDVIEGQGGIFHPGYLQVTIGLLVGSQPDAFVVCHDPLRRHVNGWADFPLPSIADVIDRTVLIGRLTNPRIRCIGVSLNTSQVPPAERDSLLARYAEETGLRCVDPLIDGVDPLVGALLDEFPR